MNWPLQRLGDLLVPVARETRVDPTKSYQLLGIRLDSQGPFHRETVSGAESSATKLFEVRSGDFIYSRLFAWRGAFGLVDDRLNGYFVSNEFPTYQARDGRIDLSFLAYWFRLPEVLRRVEEDCRGSTPLTRNRFKEKYFDQLTIELPPIEEQRRIVRKLDEVNSKISKAIALRRGADDDGEKLVSALAHRPDLSLEDKQAQGWRPVRLREVMHLQLDGHAVQVDRNYPNVGMLSFGKGLFRKVPIDGATSSAPVLYRIRTGQFIYSRLFAFEGAYGMVQSEFDGCFVSSEYPTFDCDPDQILPEFLVAYLKPSHVWRDVARGSKGLGDRRQRVQPGHLLNYEIWIPPVRDQLVLRSVSQKLDTSARRGVEALAALNELLPSILRETYARQPTASDKAA